MALEMPPRPAISIAWNLQAWPVELPAGHRVHEGVDHRRKALRLIERNPASGIPDLFDPNARIEALQVPGGLEGNDRGVADDEKTRDVDGAHQQAIVGVGWSED